MRLPCEPFGTAGEYRRYPVRKVRCRRRRRTQACGVGYEATAGIAR